ncbi:MAG: hypothetical protein PHX14_03840 [Syntrophomonadaceae bacterium]|nr:hypothetical protein [Syntrophomonadaceae bacterium]
MNPAGNDKGTTLLEILIALALVSMVASGLFAVYWAGNNAFERQSASSDAQYSARTAMQWIVRDIMGSLKSEGSPALNSDSLTLHIPVAGAEDPQEVAYFLNGSNLRRDNVAVMNNIIYLNFQRNEGSELIKVTIEARINQQSYRLVSTATPRISNASGNNGGNNGGNGGNEGNNNWTIGDDGYDGDDQFILTGGPGGGLYVSNDQGQTWEFHEFTGLLLSDFVNMHDLVWNGQELVSVGEGLLLGRIGNSANGSDWDDALPDGLGDAVLWATMSSFNGVAWGDGLYVAVGSTHTGKGRIFTSTDGSNWSQQEPPGTPWWNPLNAFTASFNGVARGSNRFVAVGDDGSIYAATNGTTWTQHNSQTASDLNAVAWSETADAYIAVGQNGTIVSSHAGTSWKVEDSGVVEALNQAVWSRDKFVAVGDSGTIVTSGDGESWNKVELPNTIAENVRNADIIDLSSCQGVLVAVVDPEVKVDGKNVLLQSNDGGVTWIQKTVDD